jgi:hypothetical protein
MTHSWFWVLTIGVLGCDPTIEIVATDGRGRGGIDESSLRGSCASGCGEQSTEGNCWCDDLCHEHDDCCIDKLEHCSDERMVDGGLGLASVCADWSDGSACDP